jgi:hypothetical protein
MHEARIATLGDCGSVAARVTDESFLEQPHLEPESIEFRFRELWFTVAE